VYSIISLRCFIVFLLMSAVVCCQADSACDRWRRRTSHDLEVERGTLAAIVKGTRHPGWDSQLGCRI